MTVAQVDAYAATVRNELVGTSDENKDICDGHLKDSSKIHEHMSPFQHDLAGNADDSMTPWLLHDRAIIGTQYYWHCSEDELSRVRNGNVSLSVIVW